MKSKNQGRDSYSFIRFQNSPQNAKWTSEIGNFSADYFKVSYCYLHFFCKNFQSRLLNLCVSYSERSSIILRTCESSTMDLEAMEVTGLVEILAKSSSNDVCHRELCPDEDLLVITIGILKSVLLSQHFYSINGKFCSLYFQIYSAAYIVQANQDQTILRLLTIILDPLNLIRP